MCFTSEDFLNETWQNYWQWSYYPLYVDFYDEVTDEKEVYVVQTVNYGRGIELIIDKKENILKDSNDRNKLPSLVNVNNLIEICRYYRLDDEVKNIYYKIGLNGDLEELTPVFEKINTRSNIAEWHFIIFK